MTSLDTLSLAAQQPQPERSVGVTEIHPVSPEFDASSLKLILQANDYLYDTSGDPVAPSAAIVQKNAYSRIQENEREHFVRELTKAFDVDVDEALHTFEVGRDGIEGADIATVQPWMKPSLGIVETGEPVHVAGCTLRLARLNLDRQDPLTLRELEVPITVSDNATGQTEQRAARFMWMTTD